MSDTRPEDRLEYETERITIIRGLNPDGDRITIIRASQPGGGTPCRHDLHGMLGVAAYRLNRDDWDQD